jgi:Domain of unknown function (DUF4430)
VTRLTVAAVAAVALLAGCGGGGAGSGKATLWVTRDEGKQVLLVRTVPAGETAMEALDRSVKLSTRYGGRFVQSIDGVSGSIGSRHDWFYFVNGIEADRGAAEYRLRPGDVEWWDYRDWGKAGQSVPVVVGAFPEPFLHGYGGKVHPTDVAYVHPSNRATALRIAEEVHARLLVGPDNAGVGKGNVIVVDSAPGELASILQRGSGVGSPVELDLGAATAARLAHDPEALRFDYGSPP